MAPSRKAAKASKTKSLILAASAGLVPITVAVVFALWHRKRRERQSRELDAARGQGLSGQARSKVRHQRIPTDLHEAEDDSE